MNSLTSIFTKTLYAFSFSIITVFTFHSSHAQATSNRIESSPARSRSLSIAAQYERHGDKTFVIESKARPNMAMGFSEYHAKDMNKLRLVSYVDGEYARFVAEIGFGGTVRIKNVENGKYLEIAENKAVHGAMISQGEKQDSRAQQFELVPLKNGYYALVSHMNSNLAIEISSRSADAPLFLSYRKGSDYQSFKLTK